MATLDAALGAIRRADALASRPSHVARLDTRAKLLATLALIVTLASFPPHAVSALVPLLLFPAYLLIGGEVPVSWLLGRLLLALPFALCVGAFNPWLDTRPLPAPWGGELAAGWFTLTSILLRVIIAVTSALLLLATSGITRIGVALAQLGVPAVLSNQLLFLYRYLFVVGDELARSWRAWQLRSPAGRTHALPPRFYRLLVGAVLARTLERALRIHQAMLARGFDGTVRLSAPPRWQARDTLFLVCWLLYLVLIRQYNLPLLLGQWLTGGYAF